MGNYRGFGDQKFIPDIKKEKLSALVANTTAFKSEKNLVFIWDQIKDRIFSLEKNELALGFSPNVSICAKIKKFYSVFMLILTVVLMILEGNDHLLLEELHRRRLETRQRVYGIECKFSKLLNK